MHAVDNRKIERDFTQDEQCCVRVFGTCTWDCHHMIIKLLQSTRARKANTMIRKDGKQAQGTYSTYNNTRSDVKELDTTNRNSKCGLQNTIKEGSFRPRRHVPPRCLGEQQHTRAVHITLTLHQIHTLLPVDTSKERPPVDSQRARRRDIAQGTKVLHDGSTEMPVRLDAGGHKGVAGVQMARMRLVLAPITQSGCSASCLGSGGNVGRAATMDAGDIQRDGTVGRGKGHFNVCQRLLTANGCISNGRLTGLRTQIEVQGP
jgi:hypothetical protein